MKFDQVEVATFTAATLIDSTPGSGTYLMRIAGGLNLWISRLPHGHHKHALT